MVVLRSGAARPPEPAAHDGRSRRRPPFDLLDSSSEFISLEPPSLSSRRIWTRSGAASAAARAAGHRGSGRADEAVSTHLGGRGGGCLNPGSAGRRASARRGRRWAVGPGRREGRWLRGGGSCRRELLVPAGSLREVLGRGRGSERGKPSPRAGAPESGVTWRKKWGAGEYLGSAPTAAIGCVVACEEARRGRRSGPPSPAPRFWSPCG